jgi:outer membrane lipoprotein SlyB
MVGPSGFRNTGSSPTAQAVPPVQAGGALRVFTKEVRTMRRSFLALLMGSILVSSACVTTTTRTVFTEGPPGPDTGRRGHVEWVRETVRQVQGNPAAGAAAGAVIGGLLGGLITGHRFGAFFGATNGALVGAAASQVHGEDTIYDVGVRFDDGETRTFRYRGYPPFRAGQSVTLTQRGLVPSGAFSASSPASATPPPPALEHGTNSGGPAVEPTTPEPGNTPPPPRTAVPSPPGPDSQTAPVGVPPGQWVFTRQYGWVWMPYGAAYTFTPDYETGDPYMYVYGPALGWTWVYAPWLWGWGPMPFIGVSGGVNFAWYGHGWGKRWHGMRPPRYRPRRR